MDVMEARRRMFFGIQHQLDTTPKIAEYGAYLARSETGIVNNTADAVDWGYTEWIAVATRFQGTATIVDNATDSAHPFQYNYITNSEEIVPGWYYGPRRSIITNPYHSLSTIRFSIELSEIDNVFAYCEESGQIFFAGKNTQYYGHRNIAELN